MGGREFSRAEDGRRGILDLGWAARGIRFLRFCAFGLVRAERAVSGHPPLSTGKLGQVEPGSWGSGPWTCLPACRLASLPAFFSPLPSSLPNQTTLFALWRGAAMSRHPPSHCMSPVLSMGPRCSSLPAGGHWMASMAKNLLRLAGDHWHDAGERFTGGTATQPRQAASGGGGRGGALLGGDRLSA